MKHKGKDLNVRLQGIRKDQKNQRTQVELAFAFVSFTDVGADATEVFSSLENPACALLFPLIELQRQIHVH